MKSPTLLILGVISGTALAAGAYAFYPQSTPVVASAKPGIVSAAEKLLAQNDARTADLARREAVVKAKLAQMGPDAPDVNAPDMKDRMATMMSAAVKQQIELKMGAIKSRLNLTDDEEKAIRALFEKEADYESGLGQKMLSGQLSADDLKKSVADKKARDAAIDQQIQGIVTPAQYIDYQNAQNDTKKSQAQMQANAEMMQVQSSLQLTDDQKDKVYTALYSGFAQQAGVDGAKPAYDDLDIDGQFEAKKAAMQAVLTPDQYATYVKFVDSQKQMYKAILGGAAAH